MQKTSAEIIKLLIVDDHQMIRDGIKVMLESQSQDVLFKITETDNGEDALKKILQHEYDIVLIDYQLSKITGAETVEKILFYKPLTKILALSNYDEISYVNNMLAAGVKGYILKNIEPSQLLLAIKTIISGKAFYSNEVAVKLIEYEKVKTIQPEKNMLGLTKMQLVILKMIAQEMKNEEIAVSLNIAKRTVDSHRQNLLNKLNAKNTVGLVKAAYLLNLV
jgi:DNA-binding NarL/FixJ family response regulator